MFKKIIFDNRILRSSYSGIHGKIPVPVSTALSKLFRSNRKKKKFCNYFFILSPNFFVRLVFKRMLTIMIFEVLSRYLPIS